MEQRACYRMASHLALQHFDLTLELPDGRSYPAEMADVSARGLAARTLSSIDPQLPSGSRVSLRIQCRARGVSLRLSAVVRDVQRLPSSSRYGLAFSQPDGLERGLPPDLFSLFNRRRAPRLPVSPQSSRDMSLATGEGSRALGRLRDISTSGASVCVSADSDPGFALGQYVSIAGNLGEDTVRMRGRVRRIRRESWGRLYGVEFDRSDPSYTGQRRRLERFIAQTEMEPTSRDDDRRASPRTPSDLPGHVEVEISGTRDRSAHATLRDLSVNGAGVSVPAREDPEFVDDETLAVLLRLPMGELELIAHVRRGLLIDDRVCYELEFDAELTDDFETRQDMIRGFVELNLSKSTADGPVGASFTP